jgi:hypothetical protein
MRSGRDIPTIDDPVGARGLTPATDDGPTNHTGALRSLRPTLYVVAVCLAVQGALALGPPTLEPLDATGRVTYFVDEGTSGSAYKPGDRELAIWALRTWERTIGGALRFDASPEREALLRVHFVQAANGQYGEMRSLTLDGRRGAAVFVRPDVDGLGPAIARLAREDPLLRDTIVYLTCLHELGHAMGLSHTAVYGDIMYFFGFGGDIPGFFDRYRRQLHARADIRTTPGISAADAARVKALYAAR